MADFGQRAKDKDRDDAIKQINDAAARGQIVDADRDKRIQEVRSAQTVGEIEMLTRGLAGAAVPPVSDPGQPTFQQYTPPTAPPVTEPDTTNPPPVSTPVPPTTVSYGEPLSSAMGTPITTPPMIKRGGGGGKLVLILVLCIVAGIAVPIFFGIKALVDGIGDLDDIVSDGKADVFSDSGYEEMVDDIEEKTGTTESFSLVMYPDYAVVEVPTEATGKRYISYRYGGTLDEFSKSSVTEDIRFDLRDIEPKILRDLLADARKLVEGPNQNYVVVQPGLLDGGKTRILAYASNDFSETGYLEADLNGKIIAEHPPS